jgi:steroid delta-isomerase-like uncharacterized protein
MTSQENKKIAERFIDEVWRQGQLDKIDELFAPDYVDHSFGPQPAGREDLKQFVAMFRQAFQDLEYDLQQVLSDGDRIASRDTVHATHKGEFMGIPATGKRVSVSAMHFLRFANGQIVEHWGITDVGGLMQQLGVGPGN